MKKIMKLLLLLLLLVNVNFGVLTNDVFATKAENTHEIIYQNVLHDLPDLPSEN